jgi:antitoxin component YwqK of YwqJK toxin-antitoxin module
MAFFEPLFDARVPSGAERNEELDAWELSERDARGVRHGECRLYRDDGSLKLRCRYEDGKRSGPFETYHPNGELESRGCYVEDALDGAVHRYSSGKPGSSPLRSCCVPPGARELRVRYRRGAAFGESFHDGAGYALRSDGTRVPERAPGVPDDATFEEAENRWILRTGDGEKLLRTTFGLDGGLVEESEMSAGHRVAYREFARSGEVAREYRFDDAGELHGPCLLRFGDDAPYLDRAIREVRGTYEHGQSVGTWRFLDGEGRERHAQNHGEALSDAGLAELLSRRPSRDGELGPPEDAVRLLAQGRVREGLLAGVVLAVRARSADELRELVARTVVPLERGAAKARAAALERDDRPSVRKALDCLLSGGEPAELFRSLATLVPAALPLARDLADAALLLEPDNSRALVTRALVRLERGDEGGALADAAALAPDLAEAAAQIRELGRVSYPRLAFVPAFEPAPEPNPELAPVGVEQPLEAIRRTVLLYATRLGMIRQALRRELGEREWLPPDVSHLLEGGPVELRRFTATITDEDEEGSQTSEVLVDETLALEGATAAELMTVARADWDALCWLCWAAGLDAVALPASSVPRAGFASAVNEAIQRCFRAHDQVRTGGLIAQSRGIPSFVWEGLAVEALTMRLAEIAARQFLERRAMFFWLLFPQNVSPFQSDLRSS